MWKTAYKKCTRKICVFRYNSETIPDRDLIFRSPEIDIPTRIYNHRFTRSLDLTGKVCRVYFKCIAEENNITISITLLNFSNFIIPEVLLVLYECLKDERFFLFRELVGLWRVNYKTYFALLWSLVICFAKCWFVTREYRIRRNDHHNIWLIV